MGKIKSAVLIMGAGLLVALNVLQAQITPPGGGGGGGGTNYGGGYTSGFSGGTPIDTNGLWLELTNVANGWSYLNLHHATNQVYSIWSTTNLSLPFAGRNVEVELWPTGNQTNVLPFSVSNFDRTDLFLRAMDWTGVFTNGLPCWWEWKYFRDFNQTTNADYDNDGKSNGYEYAHGIDPNKIRFLIAVANHQVSSTFVPVQLNISGGVPSFVSLMETTNFTGGATWYPYVSSNLVVSLNPMEGVHPIWIGLRGLPPDATQTWQQVLLTLDTTPPVVTVTNPAADTVAQPLIQLQGFINENLAGLTFDVSNAAGLFTNQTGYVTGHFYDTNLAAFTTNYFQFYDVALTNGANTVRIHATDLAGNMTTTNFNVLLDYASDTTPPVLQLVWPQNGTLIAGGNFTLQAQADDWQAGVTVSMNGDTNVIHGSVQRDGTILMPDLPLAAGTNSVSLTVTDAAGNAVTTNLTVIQSAVTVGMNPLGSGQSGQSLVSASGVISDTNYTLTVNGVSATVHGDGTWTATNVPAGPGNPSAFDLQTFDPGNISSGGLVSLATQVTEPGVVLHSVWEHYRWWDNEHLVDTTIIHGNSGIEDEHVTQDCWRDDLSTDDTDWTRDAGGSRHAYDRNNTGLCRDEDRINDFGYTLPGDYYSSWDRWYHASYDESGDDYGEPWTYHWWWQFQVQLEPAKALKTGRTYTVRAAAMDGDKSYFSTPLPPESLSIQGQALQNSGVTNDDGAVWGTTTVTLPAGSTSLDVTPDSTASPYFKFRVEIVKDKQYWQYLVMDEINADSGVAIENYKAGNGFYNNRANIKAIYLFYQKIFTEQPTEFYWAGLAKLAGAPVYAGLSDAQYCKNGLITSGFLTLDNFGAAFGLSLLESKAGQFQTDLITMNIDIYQDLDWQFEAYRKGGLDALEEINAIDDKILDINAWRKIDDGIQNDDDAEIQQGNTLLAQREQKTVLVNDYENLSSLFPGTSSLMSIFAQNPVVGGPSFAALEPSGDIANTDTRWDWVSRSYTNIGNTGIFPLWLHESASTRLLDVQQSLLYRAQNDFSLAYEYFGLTIY